MMAQFEKQTITKNPISDLSGRHFSIIFISPCPFLNDFANKISLCAPGWQTNSLLCGRPFQLQSVSIVLGRGRRAFLALQAEFSNWVIEGRKRGKEEREGGGGTGLHFPFFLPAAATAAAAPRSGQAGRSKFSCCCCFCCLPFHCQRAMLGIEGGRNRAGRCCCCWI